MEKADRPCRQLDLFSQAPEPVLFFPWKLRWQFSEGVCYSAADRPTDQKMETNTLAFIAVCLIGNATICQGEGSDQTPSNKKSILSESFVLEPVRVFYATEGESAIDPADADKNGVPDKVEDVARQVWAARKLFCEILDFPDPFDSERFSGVNCIQVSLLDRSRMNGLNGAAYRVAQKAKPVPGGNSGDRALVISVATSVDARRNATPAHEFFHLIQYGITYFSNRWFLEGMARWSESGLAIGALGKKMLSTDTGWPQNRETRDRLFAMSYDASQLLWNPLAEAVDPEGKLSTTWKLPDELTTLAYSDGSLVLRDELFSGAALMRDILIELGKVDDQAKKELGYEEWTLENQRNAKNNEYLYDSVMNVFRRVE